MSAEPDIACASTADPIPGGGANDPAVWQDRRLAILSELAEAGLEIALALKTRIVETAAGEPDPAASVACADLARAFDRASRAARMAIALRDRLSRDAAPGLQAPPPEARDRRAGRVLRIVRRVTQSVSAPATVREALDRQARESLLDPDITGDLTSRPIGVLVAEICADLGLSPPWLDFAQEAWAQAEIAERPPGSPYAAWPDLPPEDDDGDDLDSDLDGFYGEDLHSSDDHVRAEASRGDPGPSYRRGGDP